jgi:hypothetical protein
MKRTASETLAMIGDYLARPEIQGSFGRAAASSLVLTLELRHAQLTSLIRRCVTETQWDRIHLDTEENLRQFLMFEGSPERPPGLFVKSWRDANACLGMNCRKNLAQIASMIWAMGAEYDELAGKLTKEVEEFAYYGKPGLVLACEELGFQWSHLDNDEWKLIPDDDMPKTANEALK